MQVSCMSLQISCKYRACPVARLAAVARWGCSSPPLSDSPAGLVLVGQLVCFAPHAFFVPLSLLAKLLLSAPLLSLQCFAWIRAGFPRIGWSFHFVMVGRQLQLPLPSFLPASVCFLDLGFCVRPLYLVPNLVQTHDRIRMTHTSINNLDRGHD
eukprot:SAG11_NODE_2442_length_3360_cov_1.445569_2_plen_153_part_01